LLTRGNSGNVISVEGPYDFGVIRRRPTTSVLARFDPNVNNQTIAAIHAQVPPQWSIDLDPVTLHA
jgi:hypothetical protein